MEILSYRSRHRVAKRRHFYLLKALVYLQDEDAHKLTKLTGSTSNSSRKSGGTAYYCVWSINIKCEIIDDQVAQLMNQIHINPDQVPAIREAYTNEVAEKLGHLRPSEEKQLEDALKAVSEEEARTARLYATGKITDEVWDLLWQE